MSMTQMILIAADDETIARLRTKIDATDSMQVVGIFHAMRTRCTCPDDITGRHHGKLSSLGPRFKWWVHRGCGKPIPGIHRVGNLLGAIKFQRNSEPLVVIDSVVIHDHGFYNEEK